MGELAPYSTLRTWSPSRNVGRPNTRGPSVVEYLNLQLT